MSKEREVLRRVMTSELWSIQEELQVEIKELLAQPEQDKKLMTNRAIIQACPTHYCDMEKEAFKTGIKWYEKYVAIIGVYSNE